MGRSTKGNKGERCRVAAVRDLADKWYCIAAAALLAGNIAYAVSASAAEPPPTAYAALTVSLSEEERSSSATEALAGMLADVLDSEALLAPVLERAGMSEFNGAVTAAALSGTNLVELRADHADGQKAVRVLEAIAEHHSVVSGYVLGDAQVRVVAVPGLYAEQGSARGAAAAVLAAALAGGAAMAALLWYVFRRDERKAGEREVPSCSAEGKPDRPLLNLSALVKKSGREAKRLLWGGIALVLAGGIVGLTVWRQDVSRHRASAYAAVAVSDFSAENLAASRGMAKTFVSLLRSDYLRGMVSRELGRAELLQVEVTAVGSTNLVELTVEAETLPEAREALEALIRMFPAAAAPVVGESSIALLDEYGVSCETAERPGPVVCAAVGAMIGAALWLMAAAAKAVREKEPAESGSMEELLGRAEVRVDAEEIARALRGKTVLVTGGGGSIGSELCRQIALHRPRKLVIFDIYENNAYNLEQELIRLHPELDVEVIIGSVRDRKRVEEVFERCRPQLVCHAAAHKHVPLMEASPREAVKNNVFGTLHVAEAANAWGSDKFILISSDKAVNPTGVMGATKRVCEGIVRALGEKSDTVYCAVRFGNVLYSGGSVIPLFQSQIERGGPVTVTHREARRYFMTVSEAVSLVLQACAYARGGETFVLDMGEPVRIDDLARAMIRRAGLEPERDIPIVYTGLRPGEKLVEELRLEGERLEVTPNRRILAGRFEAPGRAELTEGLEELRELCEAEDGAVREALFRLARGGCPQQAGVR